MTLNSESSVVECKSMAEAVLRYSPESADFKGYFQLGQARIAAPNV